jgi:F0F1-type ATP synthase assembly protein I
MQDRLSGIFEILLLLSPLITPFVLTAFTPIKRFRQPMRLLVVAITSGLVAAFFAGGLLMERNISSRGFLIVIAISSLVAGLLSLVFSSETISEKNRDEVIRKSDDQSGPFQGG